MKTPEKVLALPPRPPTAINIVAMSWIAFSIAIGSFVIGYLTGEVISVEEKLVNVWLYIISCGLYMVAFIMGLITVIFSSKRSHYRGIVINYTEITGDDRYRPYVLQPHGLLTSVLFGAALLAAVLLFAFLTTTGLS